MMERHNTWALGIAFGAGAAIALIVALPFLLEPNRSVNEGVFLQGIENDATDLSNGFVFDAVSIKLAEGQVEFMGVFRKGLTITDSPNSVGYEVYRRDNSEKYISLSRGTLNKNQGRFELIIAPAHLRRSKLFVVIRRAD